MKGKVVVITGATSGIGQVTAERLAERGARLVLVARDKARAEVALARLRERAPGIAHCVHYADLARLSETKRVARDIAASEPRIDVLVKNAGAMFNARRVTEDGLERTFALNRMTYFLLTEGLRERLIASAPSHRSRSPTTRAYRCAHALTRTQRFSSCPSTSSCCPRERSPHCRTGGQVLACA